MDTYPLLTEVFVRIAAENGVRLTAENALSLLKGTLRDACAALSALTDVSVDELLKECRAAEAERLLDAPKLLCGIPELLLALHERGIRHYVVTHRDLRCRDMLAQCGVLMLISGFLTHEDGYPRKPAPEMVQGCLQRYALAADDCIMIGDRPLDTRAASCWTRTGALRAKSRARRGRKMSRKSRKCCCLTGACNRANRPANYDFIYMIYALRLEESPCGKCSACC